MPVITSTAPGKIILFGEHAVVYGQPAIAVPINSLHAKATIRADIHGTPGQVRLSAHDVGLDDTLKNLSPNNPLAAALRGVLSALELDSSPSCIIRVTSTIPIAAGLGSSAAISVALIRGFSAFLGHPLPDEQVSDLAYSVEKIHHGTPSGIDNTVITYAKPVYYVRGEPISTLTIAKPFSLTIADTGIPSPTSITVGDVRRAWEAEPQRYERMFAKVGEITRSARNIIESGLPDRLGLLMDQNHELLVEMGVSSPELNSLVSTAKHAGALGAKLSGGGRGGNMIALVKPNLSEEIVQALREYGAVRTIFTRVGA